MSLQLLAPIIATQDMHRSVRFYVDVLGFSCGMETPGYSNLYRDNVRIMLIPLAGYAEAHQAAFTGQFYIHLEGPQEVDALWAEIAGRAETIYAPDNFSYGMREFGVRDDNGYHLAFGASIDNPPEDSPC